MTGQIPVQNRGCTITVDTMDVASLPPVFIAFETPAASCRLLLERDEVVSLRDHLDEALEATS